MPAREGNHMRSGCKLDALDREFSFLVRTLAQWKCARCKRQFSKSEPFLTCSHFHRRANKSTRYDLENCSALCWHCHSYLDAHPAEHAAWKVAQIGHERFEMLKRRANKIQKVDEVAIRAFIRERMSEIPW